MTWFKEGPDVKQLRKNAGFGPEVSAIFAAGVRDGIEWVREEARLRHKVEAHRNIMGFECRFEDCQFQVCMYVRELLWP